MYISRLENGRVTKENFNRGFDLSCDLLCVGAGCAGVYAANAAAREGVSVILIENDVGIGGMHVHGNVKGYYYGGCGGAFEEDDEICRGAKGYHLSAFIQKKQAAETERLQRSGVKLLTEHTPTGVIFDGRRVLGIACFDGEREIYIASRIAVDSTSDGHLIRMCDVKTSIGRETDGKCAPFSVYATYIKDGKCTRINTDAGRINQYDSTDFSKKTIETHATNAKYINEGEFLNLGTHTGVREGIRFEGEETVSYEDVLLKRTPEKTLFYAYSDFDRHGHDHALDEELMQNFWVISNLSTVTVRIPFPVGAVIPKDVKGLVTAGRCFSADTYVQGTVRMVRDMFRMGECVGVMAAQSIKTGVDFGESDQAAYEKRVRELGCYAADESRDFGFTFPKNGSPYTPISFNLEENLSLLKTETPGAAIWSAFLSGDEKHADGFFKEAIETEDELYRGNLAIALGIMGDVRALPLLRVILEKRDCFYFKDCRRSNQFRSAIAACLIGRLGVTEELPLLESIVFDPREYDNPIYHTLEPNYLYYKGSDLNFVYYNIFTYSAMAIIGIYKREELKTDELNRRFRELLEEGEIVKRLTNGSSPGEHSYTEVCDFINRLITLTE